MNRTAFFTLSFLLGVLVLVYFYYLSLGQKAEDNELAASPGASVLVGDNVYTDINGSSISLSNYLGQTVVAVSWATWCPDCVKQLQAIDDAAGDNSDFITLAFNRAESPEVAQSFISFYEINTNVELVIDPTDNFFTSVNGYAMPEVVVFDSSGQIVQHYRDYVSADELNSFIDSLD